MNSKKNQKMNQSINHDEKNNMGIKPLTCLDIRESGVLADYQTGTVAAVEDHLETCLECREELQWLLRLQQEADVLTTECATVMDSIDWQKNARAICSRISFKAATPMVARGFVFGWYRAAAAAVIVFALGIGLGYLLFRSPAGYTEPGLAHNRPSATLSLARLETTMAKREVTQFFQQSQMVLTDLLQPCETQSSFFWKDHLDMNRVLVLLKKSRYFNQELNNPDLLSSRPLLQKIQWLLSEIMMNENDGSCMKLQKLQDYVRQERLLFKIHLIDKELSISEV